MQNSLHRQSCITLGKDSAFEQLHPAQSRSQQSRCPLPVKAGLLLEVHCVLPFLEKPSATLPSNKQGKQELCWWGSLLKHALSCAMRNSPRAGHAVTVPCHRSSPTSRHCSSLRWQRCSTGDLSWTSGCTWLSSARSEWLWGCSCVHLPAAPHQF